MIFLRRGGVYTKKLVTVATFCIRIYLSNFVLTNRGGYLNTSSSLTPSNILSSIIIPEIVICLFENDYLEGRGGGYGSK